MKEEFEWKGEFVFKGSAEEFTKFAEVVNGLIAAGSVTCQVADWFHWHGPFPGFPPMPIEELIGKRALGVIIEGMPRIKLAYIDDINGGMRNAHLHLQDEVVLLNREKFREFAKSVAVGLVERKVDLGENFVTVMDRFSQYA